jgi:hypothetical protein
MYLSVIELKKKETHPKHLHSVHLRNTVMTLAPSSACEQAPPLFLSRLVFEIVFLIASQVGILQCGTRLFSSSYLCIIFVKIRCGRAVPLAVPTPTSKCRYIKIPNVIYCEGLRSEIRLNNESVFLHGIRFNRLLIQFNKL